MAPGHNLNKLGNGLIDDATFQTSLWFHTIRLVYVFPIKANVKHVTPGWGHFWPQGHNLNKLAKGLIDDAKYLCFK